MLLSIYDLDNTSEKPVCTFGRGEHVIGRGSPLMCADKRISRKHAQIEVLENTATITAKHQINPCFYRAAEGKHISLLKYDHPVELNNGDRFGFFPDKYWFTIRITTGDDETDASLNETNSSTINNSNVSNVGIAENSIENVRIKVEPDLDNEDGNENGNCQQEDTVAASSSNETNNLLGNSTNNLLGNSSSNETNNLFGNKIDENIKDLNEFSNEGNNLAGEASNTNYESNEAENLNSRNENIPNNELSTTGDEVNAPEDDFKIEVTYDPVIEDKPTVPVSRDELNNTTSTTSETAAGCTESVSFANNTLAENIQDGDSSNRNAGDNEEAAASSIHSDETVRDENEPVVAGMDVDEEASDGNCGVVKVKEEPLDPDYDPNGSSSAANNTNDDNNKKVGTNDKKTFRDRCWYGATCYRKNDEHLLKYSHPNDKDYDTDPDDPRPSCSYGGFCYRRNKDHRKNFKHSRHQAPTTAQQHPVGGAAPANPTPSPNRKRKGKAKNKDSQGDEGDGLSQSNVVNTKRRRKNKNMAESPLDDFELLRHPFLDDSEDEFLIGTDISDSSDDDSQSQNT